MKSKVSFVKTSLSILAARMESLFVESAGIFGLVHEKIWALKIDNADSVKIKKKNLVVKLLKKNAP